MKLKLIIGVASIILTLTMASWAAEPGFFLASETNLSGFGPPYPFNPSPESPMITNIDGSILIDDFLAVFKRMLLDTMDVPSPPDPSATNSGNGIVTYGAQYYHTNFPDPNARFWTVRTNDLLNCPEVIECLKLDMTNQCAAMSARWWYRETKLESDRNWACSALNSIFEQATNGMSSNTLWLVITSQVVYARYTNTFGY